MDLRTELLEWLAALPAMETPEDRQELLALTGPASASLYLDWEGSSHAFVDRLLATLSWDGKATLVAFLAALQNQSWLQDATERREELAALRSQVEALSDAEFEATFLIPGAGEILETSAEPPDESLSWELPAAPAPEPPASGFPEPEPALEDTPKGAPSRPAARPRRPFESLEGLEPGDLDVDQDIETVEPGGTVTGAVIGGSGPVTVGGEHHHGDEIDTGGGTYVDGSVDVGGDLIGRERPEALFAHPQRLVGSTPIRDVPGGGVDQVAHRAGPPLKPTVAAVRTPIAVHEGQHALLPAQCRHRFQGAIDVIRVDQVHE